MQELILENWLIGRSQVMGEVREQIRAAARHDRPALITGETGVGKELAAQAIHQLSSRRDHRFLAVNCGGIPETLCTAEFFGTEAGAYTKAQKRRAGYFEQANPGTLFLDEIGDLRPDLQTMFLRVLEDGRFFRLGTAKSSVVNVRIIAATNRDLESAMRQENFRADLFYRLAFACIQIPPLRDRLDDLDDLAPHFVKLLSIQSCGDITPIKITPDAVQVLKTYSWPGNVRELQHFVGCLVMTCSGPAISPEAVCAKFRRLREAEPGTQAQTAEKDPRFPMNPSIDGDRLEQEWDRAAAALIRSLLRHTPPKQLLTKLQGTVEEKVLEAVLDEFDGSRVKAAKALGCHRNTLYLRLARLRPKPDASPQPITRTKSAEGER